MQLGTARWSLLVALVASVVLALLLSPLGFESRPQADLTVVGFVSIAGVAIGVLLGLASIFLTFRRLRLASVLAMVGSVAFLIPNITDKAGAFFTLPAPPIISALEYVHLAVLLVTLGLAWAVYRGSTPGPNATR